MAKPVILVVDPQGDASDTVAHLRVRYAQDYTVVSDADIASASRTMTALASRGERVALVLADRASNGAALLDEARVVHPQARRGLLLNWNEHRTHREEIAVAFAQRQAEGFVTKPSDTPDERFHRSITELLDEWWRIQAPRTTAVHIVSRERTTRVFEICDLLQRHSVPFAFVRADSRAGAAILESTGATADSMFERFRAILEEEGVDVSQFPEPGAEQRRVMDAVEARITTLVDVTILPHLETDQAAAGS